MNNFQCPLCDSGEYKIFLDKGKDFEYGIEGRFRLVKCVSCGLVSLFPVLTIEQLLSCYPKSYHCYNIPVSKLARLLASLLLRQQAKRIRGLIGSEGRILDVGCADGRQFDILKKFGEWQFVGIDFKDSVVKKGEAAGREIYTATLETFNYPKESFDLILMDHLLEHVVDPIETLEAAHSLLKKRGYILGAVPNITSLDRILGGRYWGGYHFPRHIWHFTPKTLSKVLEKTRFSLEELDFELHTGHWALSIQNFLQGKELTKLKVRQGRVFYYPLLLGVFIPINLFQKFFQCTGIISFVAQKE